MLEEAHGNLLAADAEALVNTVNTVGVMGKGIALQFKRAFPENFRAYVRACKRHEVELGRMFVHPTGAISNPKYVINFPTKKHWKSRSKLVDIESGLDSLREVIEKYNIRSVALPPLGCGNGGLDWADVYPAIQRALGELTEVEILVYPPVGAPAAAAMPVRTKRPNMTQTRAALILAFERYIRQSVAAGISDTGEMSIVEAQKAAYFLQVAGWPSKIEFFPSHFGPYAQTIDQFISHVEGHFIHGYGDGSSGSKATLTIDPEAVAEARRTLGNDDGLQSALDRMATIIDGFEFPYGIELLATVHYVVAQHDDPPPVDAVATAIKEWSNRKGRIFSREQAALAYDHLASAKVVNPTFPN